MEARAIANAVIAYCEMTGEAPDKVSVSHGDIEHEGTMRIVGPVSAAVPVERDEKQEPCFIDVAIKGSVYAFRVCPCHGINTIRFLLEDLFVETVIGELVGEPLLGEEA